MIQENVSQLHQKWPSQFYYAGQTVLQTLTKNSEIAGCLFLAILVHHLAAVLATQLPCHLLQNQLAVVVKSITFLHYGELR